MLARFPLLVFLLIRISTLVIRKRDDTLASWSISLFPCSKGSMRHNSPNIQPILHISISVPYSFVPNNNSGDLQSNTSLYGVTYTKE